MKSLTRKISKPLFSRLASNYKWEDPFNLEELYTEEEKGCRDTMARYAQTQLLPRVTKMWREESKNLDIFKEFGELGLFGPNIKGYGCAGVSNVAVGLMSREVERVCSGFRSMWSVTNHLVMYPIHAFGSDEIKDRFLPDLAKGNKIGCFGLTEPHAGSDPASMLTKCEKTGNDWILNGEKMWISNSPFADVFVVWAKDKSNGVIRGFVLEKGMPGLSAPPIHGKLSLRSSTTGGIVMENVKVPDANRLLKVEGLKGPFSCLNQARYGIAWGSLGAGEYCFHAARDYSLNRKQFNRPLASNQLIQTKLADMSTELSMGLVACYRAGRLKDEGTLNPETVSMIKRTCTMAALKAARTSRDIFGANGIIEDNHIMRHMTNLETVITYEGTYDIHGLILGRAITGISAFS